MDRRKELTCIICPTSCRLTVELGDGDTIKSCEGYKCKRGEIYVREEVFDPKRILTTKVRVIGGQVRMCPVRSDKPIPKEILKEAVSVVAKIQVPSPIKIHDVLVKNFLGLNADIIATRDID